MFSTNVIIATTTTTTTTAALGNILNEKSMQLRRLTQDCVIVISNCNSNSTGCPSFGLHKTDQKLVKF